MKAIILAAGEGKRMRPLTDDLPKCMLNYKHETILQRLIKQIKKQGIDDIVVVVGYKKKIITDVIKDATFIVNDRFDRDTNNYSMCLALSNAVDTDVVVFEADIIVEDDFVRYVFGTDFENKSVWFTQGRLNEGQTGGIVKTNGKGNIVDIEILDDYSKEYKDWHKTSGIMRIAKEQVKTFSKLLDSAKEKDKYFYMVWKDGIDKLPSVLGESSFFTITSFNTCNEYYNAIRKNYEFKQEHRGVFNAKINELIPIEQYDKERLSMIKKSVINDGMWIVPIRIERGLGLILDGHHSVALAKDMGLAYIPAIGFHYNEIDIWSLREEISVTKEEVIDNALHNNPYPYKTVKHKFPNVDCTCNVKLKELE